jgi:hypothetical protein
MRESTARPRGVLFTAIVLLSFATLAGQTRGQRGPSAPRAGTVIAPEAGYVTAPEKVPAGTVYPAAIPSDEFDRAYWELFDRDKYVTISGKVTKVNWTNPNAYIFIQASGAEWAIEASFIQFRQATVTPAVRVDQKITVSGFLAKDDPNPKWPVKSSPSVSSYKIAKRLIRAAEITTEYGQKLRLGRPKTEAEEAEELEKCSRLGC